MRAQLQNFQTIDTSLDAGDRPYSRVPRMQAYALGGRFLNSRFEFAASAPRSPTFCARWVPLGRARWTSRRNCAGRSATAGYFFEPVGRLSLHAIRSAERRRRCSEHADAHAALRESRHRACVRARCGLAAVSARRPWSRAWSTATCPYRNQNELPIFDTAAARLESGRAVSHQSLRRRRPHRRCEPDRHRDDHAAVQPSHGRAILVGHPRPDPLLLAPAGTAPRRDHADAAGPDAHHPCRASRPR